MQRKKIKKEEKGGEVHQLSRSNEEKKKSKRKMDNYLLDLVRPKN